MNRTLKDFREWKMKVNRIVEEEFDLSIDDLMPLWWDNQPFYNHCVSAEDAAKSFITDFKNIL